MRKQHPRGVPGDTQGETPAGAEHAADPGTQPPPDPAAAAVAAYLRAHPDFLDRHPEVLAELKVSHVTGGGAVSLVERQLSVLRGQLATERARLAQLIARARDYEAFSARLHGLVLALIAAPDLAQVEAVLAAGLTREFSAQAVRLRLFPVDAADPRHDRDPVVGAFRDFLERHHALCGPLDEAKNGALFGNPGPDGTPVRSAALIPVRAHGCCGVLAIGAADADRFRPEMGTDLLDRLGEIVSRKLEVLPIEGAVEVPAAATPAPAAKPRGPRARPRKTTPVAVLPAEPAPASAPPPPPAVDPGPDPDAAKPRRRRARPAAPE